MKILNCDRCDCEFEVSYNQWKSRRSKKRTHNINSYCSSICRTLSFGKIPKLEVVCDNCDIKFMKYDKEIRRSLNNFCCQSCAATYSNTHKSKGNRRSKLEVWLEEQLTILYPNLNILYSDKTTINSELDIYIPSLNLAIELNGIFHYEPIFGEDKLSKIQNNDGRKFQACIENGIELCIIDTSNQKYFKISTSQKYLDIITHLVNSKLELSKTDYVEVV